MDIYSFTVIFTIIFIIDHHTKWVESEIIDNKLRSTVASFFISNWVCRFGCPSKSVVDNDATFVNALLHEVTLILGTNRIHIPPYYPDSNAPIESFYRVLSKGFQRFFMNPSRLEISEVLQLILFGYRTSFHTSINDSPAFLTIGIDPRLPSSILNHRYNPENSERLAILSTIREDVIHKAHMKYLREFKANQRNR